MTGIFVPEAGVRLSKEKPIKFPAFDKPGYEKLLLSEYDYLA